MKTGETIGCIYVEQGMRAKLLKINRDVFRKSKAEKQVLKETKNAHKRAIRQAGLNPRKVMNLTYKG